MHLKYACANSLRCAQNIRNNKTHRRTPKWIQKYGLVNTSDIKRKERRSQWANRYSERNPHSALADQPLEEGQEGGSSIDLSEENADARQQRNGEYWNPNEERFYGQSDRSSATIGSSGGRWRYPANFDDAVIEPTRKKTKKKSKDKKDRWARTEDAYSVTDADTSTRRKKSKKRRTNVDSDTYSRQSDSTTEFPEDAGGGLYGPSRRAGAAGEGAANGNDVDDIFNHEL